MFDFCLHVMRKGVGCKEQGKKQKENHLSVKRW